MLTDCEQLQQALQNYADDHLDADGARFAGRMVGAETPACGVVVVAAGLATVNPNTPMTPEHLLPIGSITKTFVATRVLQLVEQGDLSLDDTLSNWWPDIPNANSITIRQLLNHTSGVYNCTDACRSQDYGPDHEWTIEEILACIDGESPLFAPGEGWSYSNTNYSLLGSIVEIVTGNRLHEEIRNSLLSPLILDHTFTLWHEEPPGALSRSYVWNAHTGSWVDQTDVDNYSFYYGEGDIASNPGDLLAWVREFATGALLEPATWDEMNDCVDGTEEWNAATATFDRYGLGIICGHDANAGEVRGHTGGVYTAMAHAWYSPSWDSSVVFQVNQGITGTPSPFYPWLFQIVSDLFAIVGEHR